ncbi:MAG: tRNA (cytidine(34)-2'-O)-methyltransferase [Planctomycetota bacterium]
MRDDGSVPRGAHVGLVLHEPEIPNNTGTIGRLCVAMGFCLHLIHPAGFSVTDRALRRSGLDYWPRLRVAEHANWASYRRAVRPERVWLLCAHGTRPIFEAGIRPGDQFVLGSETRGLPEAMIDEDPSRCLTIPMVEGERSLNLAVAAGIACGEAVRQLVSGGALESDALGRLREPVDG